MRRLIIDTDTGTDDAAALLVACAADDIEILAVTTVAGNIPLEKGTANALQTLEAAGRRIPVYPGAVKPLYRPLVCADGVHGKDGLGDRDLVRMEIFTDLNDIRTAFFTGHTDAVQDIFQLSSIRIRLLDRRSHLIDLRHKHFSNVVQSTFVFQLFFNIF